MRWFAILIATLAFHVHADEALIFNVTLDYDQERDHVATQSVFNDLTKHLSATVGRQVKLVMTQNAERVGERIRTGSYAMLLAPAQLVGLAMRNGYTPVAKTEDEARVVLVGNRKANIASLDNARGKRIALPHRESLVTYMVNGEMNAKGLAPASYFGQIMHMNQYGAVLYAMEIGQADVAASKENMIKAWLEKNRDAAVIGQLPSVPSAGVVVNDKLGEALRDRIRVAFTTIDPALEKRLTRIRLSAFDPADTADFEFVSTRGFYTPEVLPGGTIATAQQVKRLMDQGVKLFDVRPAAHYREGHIPGAVNVTYQMNSPKEVEYDDSVDAFDIGRLPQDKNTPMIFQCNGAECWYSYKAARYMIKRGYKKIYWFRTGLPAWKGAGYPVQRGT